MSLPALVVELGALLRRELDGACHLPAGLHYHFDRCSEDLSEEGRPRRVRKTLTRTVVSLSFSRFEATETVREETRDGVPFVLRSPDLEAVVPQKQRDAFDLIAHVGVEHFLHGRRLQDLWPEVCEDTEEEIPFSSFHELSRKFLYYFGELHRQSAPLLRDLLNRQGANAWLVDGTVEPGTPVYFGVKEAHSGILLHCHKIPSENVEDISRILTEAAQWFGEPGRIRHDLSENIATACEQTFPNVPHDVCHYHLLSDIGGDLFEPPQKALTKRLRALKLQVRMRDQRKGQTQWLRKNLHDPETQLTLQALLRGGALERTSEDRVLGREVLLAFHSWILDYPSDGHRQGFPFDPLVLYLHRRLLKASEALHQLLEDPGLRARSPPPLRHLQKNLEDYLNDPKVARAAQLYEAAWQLFQQLREILRLEARGTCPLSDSYSLDAREDRQMKQSLERFREETRTQAQSHPDPEIRNFHQIILDHLERYQYSLFRKSHCPQAPQERTTNGLESHWRERKRNRRTVHGRSKLSQDFQALPHEYMLLSNLEIPEYLDTILQHNETLPRALARAAKQAAPFNTWLKKTRPQHPGRLPRKLLRQEGFINQLIFTFREQCHSQ